MEKQGRPGLATAPALPIRRGIPTTRLDTPGSRRLPLLHQPLQVYAAYVCKRGFIVIRFIYLLADEVAS